MKILVKGTQKSLEANNLEVISIDGIRVVVGIVAESRLEENQGRNFLLILF